ncbi:tetraacyldisaccharide 4'-kinase [Alteromonas gracilis]|uniref:tetraacyldisaccharide 4'-kinase n=1 Tax=Alteromonas gracilis TaxID=1479524 RepID=UPI003219A407
MGLQLAETKALPDHHAFSQQDIVSGTVIMTEKDAVKVKAFAHHDCWYLPVTAQISADFYQLIDSKLLNAGLRLNKEIKE